MKTLSDAFGIKSEEFERYGILDAFIEIDTHLFVDPLLLKNTQIEEFKNSRKKIEQHFTKIAKLLSLSNAPYDILWREAFRMLVFREVRGVAIGHGSRSSNGSGIGPKLAGQLVKRAKELIDIGIKDPEVFELVGLFIEDFGPDRLSDMTINIIREDFYSFTENIANKLGIKLLSTYKTKSRTYRLPLHPINNTPVILVPKSLLKPLPVASSWEEIDYIVQYNAELRSRLNELIDDIFSEQTKKKRKEIIREKLYENSIEFQKLVDVYKNYIPTEYDYKKDPAGEITFNAVGLDFAAKNPLSLSLKDNPSLSDIENVVSEIIKQYKKNIELNGLNEHLYYKENGKTKKRHEKYSQLLFFVLSDIYCKANNIDLNREPNAGKGPIDFKYSNGYNLRHLVEIKLSTNDLVHGYTKQLKLYMDSESTESGSFIVIRVHDGMEKIEEINKIYRELVDAGKSPTKIYIIDGRIKPSASIKNNY